MVISDWTKCLPPGTRMGSPFTTHQSLFTIPVQFLAQHPVVAVLGGMEQADGVGIAPHRDAVTLAQLETGMGVEMGACVRRIADDDVYDRIAVDDNRAVRKRRV